MKNEKTLGEILRERKEITNIQSVNNFVDNLIHSLDFLDHRINQLKNEEKNDYLMEVLLKELDNIKERFKIKKQEI